MWFSVSEHLTVTFYSLFMGVFLGILYDCIKLTRIIFGVGFYSTIASSLYNKEFPFIRKTRAKLKCGNGNGAVSGVILFIGDIVYACLCAVSYSLFLFHASRGEARWYFILASAVGFFVYYFTISKLALSVLEVVLFFVRALMRYTTEVIIWPVRKLYRLVNLVIQVIYHKLVLPLFENIRYNKYKKYTEKIRKNLSAELKFSKDV